MADITLMRGYGFPRGSGMDYAGYGSHKPPQRSAASRIPLVPEPSLFAKIPALDGLGEDFGTEYVFEEEEPITPNPTYGPEYRPDLLNPGGGNKWLFGLGLLAAGWWLFRR